jgi:hypothetical protein
MLWPLFQEDNTVQRTLLDPIAHAPKLYFVSKSANSLFQISNPIYYSHPFFNNGSDPPSICAR